MFMAKIPLPPPTTNYMHGRLNWPNTINAVKLAKLDMHRTIKHIYISISVFSD